MASDQEKLRPFAIRLIAWFKWAAKATLKVLKRIYGSKLPPYNLLVYYAIDPAFPDAGKNLLEQLFVQSDEDLVPCVTLVSDAETARMYRSYGFEGPTLSKNLKSKGLKGKRDAHFQGWPDAHILVRRPGRGGTSATPGRNSSMTSIEWEETETVVSDDSADDEALM